MHEIIEFDSHEPRRSCHGRRSRTLTRTGWLCWWRQLASGRPAFSRASPGTTVSSPTVKVHVHKRGWLTLQFGLHLCLHNQWTLDSRRVCWRAIRSAALTIRREGANELKRLASARGTKSAAKHNCTYKWAFGYETAEAPSVRLTYFGVEFDVEWVSLAAVQPRRRAVAWTLLVEHDRNRELTSVVSWRTKRQDTVLSYALTNHRCHNLFFDLE